MGSMTRRIAKRTMVVQSRKNARSKDPGGAGKLITARDGRVALCVSSRPREKKLLVRCEGRLYLWGQLEISDEELCRVMGVTVTP